MGNFWYRIRSGDRRNLSALTDLYADAETQTVRQTDRHDQGRIKVFGGPRLDTILWLEAGVT